MIVARFGMAAGTEITAMVVAPKEVAGNRANHREQKTQSQAGNVDNHNASLAHVWLIYPRNISQSKPLNPARRRRSTSRPTCLRRLAIVAPSPPSLSAPHSSAPRPWPHPHL